MKLLKIVTTLIIAMFGMFTLCSCGDKDGKETTEKQGFSDLFEDDVIVKYDTDNGMYTEKITIDKLFSDDGIVDMESFTYPAKYSYELTFVANKDFTIKSISYDLSFTLDEEEVNRRKDYYSNLTSIKPYDPTYFTYPQPYFKNAKIEDVQEKISLTALCQIGDELSDNYSYNYEANEGKNAYKDSLVKPYFVFVGNSNNRTERINIEYNIEIKKGEYLSLMPGGGWCKIDGDLTDLDKNNTYEDCFMCTIDIINEKFSNLLFEEA